MVNLRTIKKNGKEYYYLEHTLREGDIFRNIRKYLGTEIPSNIDEIKEAFTNEIILERYKKEIRTIKINFSKEFSKYPKSAKKKYIESFMINFTYDTNKIEGSTLTLKETADLLQEQITPKNKPLSDVKEAEAHREVFYDMLDYKKDLDLAIVIHWHKMLLSESKPDITGIIRKHPVAIARSKVELPFPAELDILLYDFFVWYKKARTKIHPVILAALVHLKFVSIHPFSDGNGRISRIMMNFVLHKNGFPMLNIGYSNRNSYYNALERSQIKSNNHFFVLYLIKRYIDFYRRYI